MADTTYILPRLPIANKAVRLLVAALLWLAVLLGCLIIITVTALITLGSVAALFAGALGIVVFNAPFNFIKTLRNNL